MKTNNYTSSKFNSVSGNILLWGGVIILLIAFKHNIIAQTTKPDPDKPIDGGCETCPPGPCDIWVLTQTIDWSQPSKTTTGLPIELGIYEENTVSASQVFSPYETISNKKIIIEGYFTIDIPITVNNCEIIINPSMGITPTS